MNIHKRQNQQIQRVLADLHRDPVKVQTLLSTQFNGITSQEFAEQFVEQAYRPVYKALQSLVSPPGGSLPLLNAIPVALAGKKGRPRMCYVLTEWGAEVVSLLDPSIGVSPPSLRNVQDLHHRFCGLETLLSAHQQGLMLQLEHVLPYNQHHSVRADGYANLGERQIVLEIEQELSSNNAPRAVEKFERWQSYVTANGGRNSGLEMYLVFNLTGKNLQVTRQRWQKALAQAEQRQGELLFSVFWIPIHAFFGASLSIALEQATPLEALVLEEEEAQLQSVEPPRPETQTLPAWIQPFYADYMERVTAYQDADTPRLRILKFVELAYGLHQVSFHSESDTVRYAAQPRESLWLMRDYLHHPKNQALLTELKTALSWTQKRTGNFGVTMYRDAATRIIWDVFLRQHGFGRGGALRASFQVPDFQDNRSDYWVEVQITGDVRKEISYIYLREKIEAISWMLSSLFIYPEELQLGVPNWKYQTKTKGVKK